MEIESPRHRFAVNREIPRDRGPLWHRLLHGVRPPPVRHGQIREALPGRKRVQEPPASREIRQVNQSGKNKSQANRTAILSA